MVDITEIPTNPAQAIKYMIDLRTQRKPEPVTRILNQLEFFGDDTYSGDATVGDADNINANVIKIDASTGTATTYGELQGTPDGSLTKFGVSNPGGFETGSTQVWMNGQEQTRSVDYTEDAGESTVTFATAPTTGAIIIIRYKTSTLYDNSAYASSDATTDTLTISGAINGANTDFTMPGPYKSGALILTLNGQAQTQGTGEDFTELSATAGTVRFATAPASGSEIQAFYEPALGGWRYENTAGTLTYTFDGSNTRGTCSSAYTPGKLILVANGIILDPGDDYAETDPTAGTFDTTTAFDSGSVLAAIYPVATTQNEPQSPEFPITAVSSNYTATVYDQTILGNATGGNISITLPANVDVSGKLFNIKKTDASANTVTVTPSGAATIDGAATYTLAAQYSGITIQSDGTDWWILQ